MNLTNDIAQFFATLPHINVLNVRKALIYQANLKEQDDELVRRIDFTGETQSFCRNVTRILTTHGKLADGRDALDAVLAALEGNIDTEKQAECDRLRQRWRDAQSAPLPPLKSKSRRIVLIGLIAFLLFAIAGGAFLLKDRLTSATISGIVNDERTLTPLADVRVFGEGFEETTTNAVGKFEVSVPENHQRATYRLTFSRTGYASKSILKRPGETFEVRLKPIEKN